MAAKFLLNTATSKSIWSSSHSVASIHAPSVAEAIAHRAWRPPDPDGRVWSIEADPSTSRLTAYDRRVRIDRRSYMRS